MEESEIKRIGLPKDLSQITPTTLVNNLLDNLGNLEEIYCVVKTKDGSFIEVCSGNAGGVAFSIVVLQNYVMGLL